MVSCWRSQARQVELWRLAVPACLILAMLPFSALAQEDRGVHDMSYTSPNWGYHVRWYSDEWSIEQESSDGAIDSLWLTDAVGNVIGFDGGPGYDGDAVSCLDDMYAQ